MQFIVFEEVNNELNSVGRVAINKDDIFDIKFLDKNEKEFYYIIRSISSFPLRVISKEETLIDFISALNKKIKE